MFLEHFRDDYSMLRYEQALAASPEDYRNWLHESLKHAADTVPFYRRLRQTQGLAPDDLTTWPILSRADIQGNLDTLQSQPPPPKITRIGTSGSTGVPLTVVHDRAQREWSRAADHWFFFQMMNIDPLTSSKVILWNAPHAVQRDPRDWRKRVHHWLTRTNLCTPTFLSEELLDSLLALIDREKPAVIKGYAWTLWQLARRAQLRGVRHSPKAIYSTAEVMRPFMRAGIEEVFQSEMHDMYGCREFGNIAGQCRKGRYHVFSFAVHLEVLDDRGQPVAPGQTGNVVLTTLHNRAMPLVRYALGDLAIPADGCDCGSCLPALESIKGRVIDYFKLADNTLIDTGMFFQFFYGRQWLHEFSLVQREYDQVDINVVTRGEIPAEHTRQIEDGIRHYMGKHCRLEWHDLPELPPSPGGKFQYVRSYVE